MVRPEWVTLDKLTVCLAGRVGHKQRYVFE